jgi:hypothetical protein
LVGEYNLFGVRGAPLNLPNCGFGEKLRIRISLPAIRVLRLLCLH